MTLEPWQVDGTRVTYEDDWLEVLTDRCRTADGRLLGDYHRSETLTATRASLLRRLTAPSDGDGATTMR